MYCVTIRSSWSKSNMETYAFSSKEAAEKFLQEAWQDQFNAEIADNVKASMAGEDGMLLEDFSYHEDDYAVINYSDLSKIEFMLSKVKKAPGQKEHHVFVLA